jgi:hypothetical protein
MTFYAGESEGNDVCVGTRCERDATTEVILGARHLRLLHLYIAYRERAVYATVAN